MELDSCRPKTYCALCWSFTPYAKVVYHKKSFSKVGRRVQTVIGQTSLWNRPQGWDSPSSIITILFSRRVFKGKLPIVNLYSRVLMLVNLDPGVLDFFFSFPLELLVEISDQIHAIDVSRWKKERKKKEKKKEKRKKKKE